MKSIIGHVVSDKMTNTVVIETTSLVAHPLYSKRLRRTRKIHAHNLVGAKTGDRVRLVEIKPISKTKNWLVEAVL